MEAVRRHFRPEFINRVDEIVQFDPLSPPQLREVARLQVGGRRRAVTAEGLAVDGVAIVVLGSDGGCGWVEAGARGAGGRSAACSIALFDLLGINRRAGVEP
jgi:ATP-dependent Clp protease ATP-binding subunit ClpA